MLNFIYFKNIYFFKSALWQSTKQNELNLEKNNFQKIILNSRKAEGDQLVI